jgi:hypothetical protein
MALVRVVLTYEICDADCPARAKYKVFLKNGNLFFCTHHYLKLEKSLEDFNTD